MEIHLLNTSSDPRTLAKTAQTIAVTECEPFGVFDIESPILRVKPFTGFGVVNAFYIPEYMRYYSISKTVRLSGNIIEIYGSVDVLWTYKEAIRNCSAVCISNENIKAGFVPDNNFPVDVRKETIVYQFEGEPFNTETASDSTYNFVLNVAGGEASE